MACLLLLDTVTSQGRVTSTQSLDGLDHPCWVFYIQMTIQRVTQQLDKQQLRERENKFHSHCCLPLLLWCVPVTGRIYESVRLDKDTMKMYPQSSRKKARTVELLVCALLSLIHSHFQCRLVGNSFILAATIAATIAFAATTTARLQLMLNLNFDCHCNLRRAPPSPSLQFTIHSSLLHFTF